jgi:hypothetical protein
MMLPETFEKESWRLIEEAQERLKRFERAPENRNRLREVRGERLLYWVSQTVLTAAGCILVTAFLWAEFFRRGLMVFFDGQ